MRTFNILFIVAFAIIFCNTAQGKNVTIYGKNKTYAGKEISFYSIEEYFTFSKTNWCTVHVNDSGEFSCNFNIEKTEKIMSDLGVFEAFFYAEPEKNYTIVIPDRVDKEIKDELNPYFEPLKIHLGIIGISEKDINVQIKMFNDSYNPFFKKHVANVVKEKDFETLDDDIEKITAPFVNIENTYFKDYVAYKIAILRFLAFQTKSQKSSDNYFDNKPILYSNEAYMELFNQVYDKYLMYFGRTDEGKRIFEDINRFGSLYRLNQTLKKNKTLQGSELREIVILKNLHEEYYNSNFSRSKLIVVLDSIISFSPFEGHQAIAKRIKTKVTKLSNGYAPPAFKLYNQDSVLITLDSLKGKYVYLNFCTSHSYSCIQEYEALKYLYQKYKDYIEIVTISIDMDFRTMLRSRKQTQCPWTFLHYASQPEIIEQYDIRTFPTYFLIDKEGKLAISPAPTPGQQIEKKLFELLRSRGDI